MIVAGIVTVSVLKNALAMLSVVVPLEQHGFVVVEREFRRRFGGDEDPLAAPADLLVVAGPDDSRRWPATVIVSPSPRSAVSPACIGADRRARMCPRRLISPRQIAARQTGCLRPRKARRRCDPIVIGIGGAQHHVLLGREHRLPPARCRNLVGGAERRHEQPDGREQPQQHQQRRPRCGRPR